ncbi:hydantoinase/oxoprolinase family protein [Bradyrhizobium sp. URHD0069]|uniref:hydantoinase/oxoprolinase family protein n=1 Tax=Bradyrhizobium sp. URHD0069 TaxID=1380355 RepID=UPI00049801B5|nr:hydantoinase/oxoprolinase family protein [Bradyrhizobium sp. URHD0069]
MRVGVEVGGTFTDLVAIDNDRIAITKVPSTPSAPEQGAFHAVSAAGLEVKGIKDFAHGSTVATNAILERKGAKIAFVTTAGFRDLLQLQRHDRRNIYNLQYQKPEPIVPRSGSFEVNERILPDGSVLTALSEADVIKNLVPALRAGSFRAVAVCLLNSYANSEHEEKLGKLLRSHLPGVSVTCSTEVVREFREYERASTTALSAYVQPVIAGYLSRFSQWLNDKTFDGQFTVMQSNGGLLPAEAMARSAITALFSGPAAGVVGAARLAALSGYRNLITFDMGGTSTDVSLVVDGEPSLATETEIDRLPLRTPVLDIVTVGAGGGSIVWIDDGGMLRVGPQSSGATPGPACYGKGGTLPTITDAHVVCGAIHPDTQLGGRIKVDLDAARKAFAPVAEALKLSIEEAAESAIRLANANIVRAIQLVSTERGRDPRDYVIVPFGGAGSLHATAVATDLGVDKVVVPPNPGVISAYGLLASDCVKHDSLTHRIRLNAEAPALVHKDFEKLRESLQRQMEEIGLGAPYEWTYGIDMRFVGQAFEVTVYFDYESIENLTQDEMERRFVDAHQRAFFHGAASKRAIEIICLRVAIRKKLATVPRLMREANTSEHFSDAPLFSDWKWNETKRLADGLLKIGESIKGPAVLHGTTATVLVGVGWSGHIDEQDNLILEKDKA